MDSAKTFRTKTGYCHILPDKIVLTREGVVGNLSQITMGNSIARPIVIYGIICVAFYALAFKAFKQNDTLPAGIFFILASLLLLGIYKSLNNSAAPMIEREKVRKVSFKSANPGATRSYFIVHFENEKGKIRQRLIMLPGSLSGGKNETEKAFAIMASEFQIVK